jgi:HEAT repeat protein
MEPARDDLVALIGDPPAFLTSDVSTLRRMAVTALSPSQALANATTLAALGRDDDAAVRAAVAEKLGVCGATGIDALPHLRDDPEPVVREAAATAYGELAAPEAVPWLTTTAFEDPDRGVREAAVAALGSIADDAAIEPLLQLIASGPPQVRRRAIAAITVFDDPRIEPAITRAAFDRNPSVREAAEMVVGRQLGEAPSGS